MYKIFRSILFLFEPEKAHALTARLLHVLLFVPGVKRLFTRKFCADDDRLKRTLWGLTFSNPVGLAAGFDKNARLYTDFSYCGFGFIEIGTLTPRPQKGNPRPRLFRLKKDQALINRMGFNNHGVEWATSQLKKRKKNIIIGGNIGKNKDTHNDLAVNDYLDAFETLYPYVDYFVVNVSSPNTPNLRELQEKKTLKKLLSILQERNKSMPSPKPILVKIAPDLSNQQLDDIVDIVLTTPIDGVIATNTTVDRHGLDLSQQEKQHIGAGGLSGQPLNKRSTEVIRYLADKSNRAFPIIGVGGISSPSDALEKIEAGASLIQIYTGFIYQGPKLIRDIKRALLKMAKS